MNGNVVVNAISSTYYGINIERLGPYKPSAYSNSGVDGWKFYVDGVAATTSKIPYYIKLPKGYRLLYAKATGLIMSNISTERESWIHSIQSGNYFIGSINEANYPSEVVSVSYDTPNSSYTPIPALLSYNYYCFVRKNP